MKQIILASNSPRRKELLRQIGLEFKVVGSDYEEDMTLLMSPPDLAKHLSKGKAESVARKQKNAIVIAADTFVTLKKEILRKPHTEEKAKMMLKKISGQALSVITGLTIIDTEKNISISDAEITKVIIKKLSNREIDAYIKTGEPLDKAGAFGIQEKAAIFIKKIEGDYSNVVGLPLHKLYSILDKIGYQLLK